MYSDIKSSLYLYGIENINGNVISKQLIIKNILNRKIERYNIIDQSLEIVSKALLAQYRKTEMKVSYLRFRQNFNIQCGVEFQKTYRLFDEIGFKDFALSFIGDTVYIESLGLNHTLNFITTSKLFGRLLDSTGFGITYPFRFKTFGDFTNKEIITLYILQEMLINLPKAYPSPHQIAIIDDRILLNYYLEPSISNILITYVLIIILPMIPKIITYYRILRI